MPQYIENLEIGGGNVTLDADGTVTVTGDIVLNEKADHTETPAAGKGQLWVKNTTPATLVFTNDAGTDTTLGAGSGISSGDITGLTTVSAASGDYVLITDASDGNNLKKVDAGDFLAGSGDALTTDPLSQFAATTSAQLAGVISDETGSGALVFGTSPTLTTPALGTPSALTLTNATGLPVGGIDATGTPGSGNFLRGDGSWQTPGGSGTVTSVAVSGSDGIEVDSGSPVTSSGTIALGVNAATLRSHINVADGADVSPVASVNSATGAVVLDADDIDDAATTNKFVTASDVTNLGNLSGTNSGDVTLAGSLDYITLADQVLTRNAIDLAADVTGDLPFANIAQIDTARITGRTTAGTGDIEALTPVQADRVIRNKSEISSTTNATAWTVGSKQYYDTLTENTTVSAPTGTLVDLDIVVFAFTQAATPYTVGWNAIFVADDGLNANIPAMAIGNGNVGYYMYIYNATANKLMLLAHKEYTP